MFTGLVEAVGTVSGLQDLEGARRLTVAAPTLGGQLSLGESVSVDGACLTVVEAIPEGFSVEVVGSTLSRTVAGQYRVGARVNLERAVEVGERLGGHLVQGHVDGVAEVLAVHRQGEYQLLDFHLPEDVEALTVLHGSIAISGVSLTVNALTPGRCQVAVIPHTWKHTNLSDLRAGDSVNVEGDMIGKFVARIVTPWKSAHSGLSPSAPPD
jgi:riboflavin synthase